MNQPLAAGAGGVLLQSDTVLLVQANYGANKGQWMLPGGFVEAGESIEEAAIREFWEETGLNVSIKRMAGVRSGIRETPNGAEASIYVVFEMEYGSGELKKDEREIAGLKYWNIADAMQSSEVIDLAKQFIESACCKAGGLSPGRETVRTNNGYKEYSYYRIYNDN